MESEEGSCFAAPAENPESDSNVDALRSPVAGKKCTACGTFVKGHIGICGQGKCLSSLVSVLLTRLDELEKRDSVREAQFRQQEDLSAQRQEALLVTIASQDDRIEKLQRELREVRTATTRNQCECSRCVELEVESEKLHSRKPSKRHQLAFAVGAVKAAKFGEDNFGGQGAVESGLISVQPSETGLLGGEQEGQPLRTPLRTAAEKERKDASQVRDDARTVNSERSSSDCVRTNGDTRTQTQSYSNAVGKPGILPVRLHRTDAEGFTEVRSRRNKHMQHKPTGPGKKSASTLKGSERVRCKPFYVARVSLDSSAEDVINYCQTRGVIATGCYDLPTHVWGTRTMKVFLDAAAETAVLSDDFWPEYVRCRAWSKEPPKRHAFSSAQSGEIPVVEKEIAVSQ